MEVLLKEALEGKIKHSRPVVRRGNHRVERDYSLDDEYHNFIYWSTTICRVNVDEKTFKLENGGYNTSSTNRAIWCYRNLLYAKGFKNISTHEKYREYDEKVLAKELEEKQKLIAEGEKEQAKKSFYED